MLRYASSLPVGKDSAEKQSGRKDVRRRLRRDHVHGHPFQRQRSRILPRALVTPAAQVPAGTSSDVVSQSMTQRGLPMPARRQRRVGVNSSPCRAKHGVGKAEVIACQQSKSGPKVYHVPTLKDTLWGTYCHYSAIVFVCSVGCNAKERLSLVRPDAEIGTRLVG